MYYLMHCTSLYLAPSDLERIRLQVHEPAYQPQLEALSKKRAEC